MNLKRYSFIALAASGMLLASCANNAISYEKAYNFVKDNYNLKDTKDAIKEIVEFSGKAKDDNSKKWLLSTARLLSEDPTLTLDKNLHYYKEYDVKDPQYSLTPEGLVKSGGGSKVTYYLNGKSLTVKAITNVKEEAEINQEVKETYNNEGYPKTLYQKLSHKGQAFDWEEGDVLIVDGSYTFKVTYTY